MAELRPATQAQRETSANLNEDSRVNTFIVEDGEIVEISEYFEADAGGKTISYVAKLKDRPQVIYYNGLWRQKIGTDGKKVELKGDVNQFVRDVPTMSDAKRAEEFRKKFPVGTKLQSVHVYFPSRMRKTGEHYEAVSQQWSEVK